MTGQMRIGERKQRARRFVLMLLVAAALVAQGFAGHIWRAQSRFAEAGGVNLSSDEACKSSSDRAGSGAPHGKAVAPCCILCRMADKDQLAPEPALASIITLLPVAMSSELAIWPAFSLRDQRPSGCGCTWSAQAPPGSRFL